MAAKLSIQQDAGRVTEFPLLKAEVKIGRTPLRNDLVLDDPAVSREHAAIRRSGSRWVVADLQSANGTTVNGAMIEAPTLLEAGDVIAIGKSTIVFTPEPPPLPPPPPPPPLPPPLPEPPNAGVRFDDAHESEVGGTVMISLNPEELMSALRAPTSPGGGTLPESAERTTTPQALRAPQTEMERLQKKAKILALLYDLGKALGTSYSLPDIYRNATEALFSVTPADHCLILLVEPGSTELKPVSIQARSTPDLVRSLRSPIRPNIVVSRTITSRVVRERLAFLVYDAQKEFGSDSIMMQAIHSAMCAPLLGKDGLLGAIYVDRRDLLSRFEEDDLDLLSAIASQTAIAIEGSLTREQLQREAIVRDKLGRFLPAGVVERVIAGEIKLGGVAQEITTLFADIRGFTPMSERTTPETVVEILNEHFTIMTDSVLRNMGTLDKYIGDSVMALFGAPENDPEVDPVNAVSAAIGMQQGMTKVNEKLTARGLPNIKIGIGINTGVAIVGEIGSERQMNYTAIGDSVNLAARLESNAQPGQILISAETAVRLRGAFALNALPPIKVKGKSDPIPVYEVVWGGEA